MGMTKMILKAKCPKCGRTMDVVDTVSSGVCVLASHPSDDGLHRNITVRIDAVRELTAARVDRFERHGETQFAAALETVMERYEKRVTDHARINVRRAKLGLSAR